MAVDRSESQWLVGFDSNLGFRGSEQRGEAARIWAVGRRIDGWRRHQEFAPERRNFGKSSGQPGVLVRNADLAGQGTSALIRLLIITYQKLDLPQNQVWLLTMPDTDSNTTKQHHLSSSIIHRSSYLTLAIPSSHLNWSHSIYFSFFTYLHEGVFALSHRGEYGISNIIPRHSTLLR